MVVLCSNVLQRSLHAGRKVNIGNGSALDITRNDSRINAFKDILRKL
jgi:hypothetical protein